jgi:DNA-binding NtrC family response regulator
MRDRLIDGIDELLHAGQRVIDAVRAGDEVLGSGQRHLEAGANPLEVALSMMDLGAEPLRSAVSSSFQDYERAAMELRQAFVRAVIDEHGWTVSQVARQIGISRQRVSRLYQAAKRS